MLPATSTLVETAAAVELTLTFRPAPMTMPGTVTEIWALRLPAMPAGVTSRMPVPWVTETVLPSDTVTALAVTSTSSPRLPKEKVPVSDCPPKASVAPVATSSSTGAAVANVDVDGRRAARHLEGLVDDQAGGVDPGGDGAASG